MMNMDSTSEQEIDRMKWKMLTINKLSLKIRMVD